MYLVKPTDVTMLRMYFFLELHQHVSGIIMPIIRIQIYQDCFMISCGAAWLCGLWS
jgi:hypothetical protein